MKKYITAITLIAAGCTGTDVGNPVESQNDVALLDPSFQAGELLGPDSGTVTEAWIVVEDLRLYRGEDCSDRFARFEEEFAIDLLGHGFTEMFSSVNLSEACEIDFDISPMEEPLPDEAPAGLIGVGVYFAGTWGDEGRFEVRIRSLENIHIAARGGQVAAGAQKLFFTVVARDLFANSYLDTASVDVDGVVRIEEGQNDSLRLAIEAALRAAFRIYDDDDDNGALDDDEYDSDDDILAD